MKRLLGVISIIFLLAGLTIFILNKPSSSIPIETKEPLLVTSIEETQTDLTSSSTLANDDLTREQLDVADKYFRELDQGNQIKQSLQQMQHIDDESKEVVADQLMQQIKASEKNHHISVTESLFLKLAVMRHLLGENEYQAYAQQEIQTFKQHSQQQWDDYLNNRDPQFLDYKQREALLVQEIMQMTSFPDGLAQEEYLRLRIEALKREAYSLEPNASTR